MPEGISRLLQRWSDGDASAFDELMPMVYEDLRKLARSRLRREGDSVTIEPTMLVHEAYLRLAKEGDLHFEGRAQFFGLAARVMRNVIVDYCRRKNATKRWGDGFRVSFSHIDRKINLSDSEFLRLNDALTDLAALKPVHARIVELRFFGGLSVKETAGVLNVAPTTVERYWRFARAWLAKTLGPEASADALDREDRGDGQT